MLLCTDGVVRACTCRNNTKICCLALKGGGKDIFVDMVQVGGECGVLVLHNRAMKEVGFNAEEPVYVASAIFSLTHPSPANLHKIITYSADLLGARGDKVSTLLVFIQLH